MWKLDANGRMTHWRRFRKTLDTLELEPALQATADFWHACPFVPYYLDPEQPETWPNPWELILDNYYCDLAKTLGMLYTIFFTVHAPALDSEIRIYQDPETRLVYNLVSFNQGKYMLNFKDGAVVNTLLLNKNLTLQHCYTARELRLQEY